MKEFDIKDVYSVINADEAREYVGTKGYFAYTISSLKEKVLKNIVATLDDINQLQDYPFITNGQEYSLFFLPVSKVKDIEKKKYRPFKDIQEFLMYYKIGELIELKLKPKDIETEYDGGEMVGAFVGYRTYTDEKAMYVLIGGLYFQINDVEEMNTTQIKNSNNEWQPFGVEE